MGSKGGSKPMAILPTHVQNRAWVPEQISNYLNQFTQTGAEGLKQTASDYFKAKTAAGLGGTNVFAKNPQALARAYGMNYNLATQKPWLKDISVSRSLEEMSKNQNLASRPYIQQASQITQSAQPYIGEGAGYYRQAQPYLTQAGDLYTKTSQGQLAGSMDPFREQVTNEMMRLGIRGMQEQAIPEAAAGFLGGGGFGSTAAERQGTQIARDTIADITGQQGQFLSQEWNNQMARQLQSAAGLGETAAGMGNIGQGMYGAAGQLGQLGQGMLGVAGQQQAMAQNTAQLAQLRAAIGQQVQGQHYTDVQALAQQGLAQRQDQQNKLNYLLAEFEKRFNWDPNQAQWAMNLLTTAASPWAGSGDTWNLDIQKFTSDPRVKELIGDAPKNVLDAIIDTNSKVWKYKDGSGENPEPKYLGPMADELRDKLGIGSGSEYSGLDLLGAHHAAIADLGKELKALKHKQRQYSKKSVH